MDFEEYKKYQEKFMPIDTPEKLNQIREMYNNWVLMQEDLNFLEPVEKDLADEFSNKEYFRLIESTFHPLQLENEALNILVIPSFGKEYQFSFSSKSVTVTYVFNQIWSDVYRGNQSNTQTKTVALAIPQIEKEKIITNTKKLIETARKPNGTLGILDGVMYYFIYKEGEHIQIAFKNPSEEASPVSKLINKLNTIIEKQKDLQHILE